MGHRWTLRCDVMPNPPASHECMESSKGGLVQSDAAAASLRTDVPPAGITHGHRRQPPLVQHRQRGGKECATVVGAPAIVS